MGKEIIFFPQVKILHFNGKSWRNKKLQKEAYKKHPDNPNAAASLYTRLIERDCAVKINLLSHSMGNYVLKHTFSTSENATSQLVFDNICLVAADTNNENHAQWVGQLDVRNFRKNRQKWNVDGLERRAKDGKNRCHGCEL